jgi:hypothetical protein
MSVAKPVIVELADMPLDARIRCNNVDDFPNIETPYIGMLIYTLDDGKFWVVTKLKSKLIGSMAVENMAIDKYVEFPSGGGGGYANGDGISISDDNVISVDFDVVARKDDIKTYKEGEGISVSDNTISVDFDVVAKKSDIKTYKAGTNISIAEDGTISCTVSGGGGSYTAGTGIAISAENAISVDTEVIASREYIDGKIGDIDTILDSINGEVI